MRLISCRFIINHNYYSVLLFQRPKAKPLNTLSNKWGSFFIDSISGQENTADSMVHTWSSKRISTYSTIAIPSIEAIAGKGENTYAALPASR
jgi:hypothetical protein